jgi:hypothetical protein
VDFTVHAVRDGLERELREEVSGIVQAGVGAYQWCSGRILVQAEHGTAFVTDLPERIAAGVVLVEGNNFFPGGRVQIRERHGAFDEPAVRIETRFELRPHHVLTQEGAFEFLECEIACAVSGSGQWRGEGFNFGVHFPEILIARILEVGALQGQPCGPVGAVGFAWRVGDPVVHGAELLTVEDIAGPQWVGDAAGHGAQVDAIEFVAGLLCRLERPDSRAHHC